MRPPIVAFQQHHSTYWDRVALALVSAMQYLSAIETLTGVPRPELHAVLVCAREEASAGRAEGQRRLREFAADDPDRYMRCVRGLEPWPDEDATTFTGRCTCRDGYPDVPACPVPGHPLETAA